MNELLGQGGGGQAPAPGPPVPPGNALAGSTPAPGPQSPAQLLAPIIQANTDPTTGELNYNRAFVALASSPGTAPLAPGFLRKASEGGATVPGVALAELEKEYSRQGLIAGTVKPLLDLGANITQGDLIRAIASPEFTRAVPDSRMRAQILASAPKGGVQLAQWVTQRAVQSEGAVKSMEQVMGEIQQGHVAELQAQQQAGQQPEAPPEGPAAAPPLPSIATGAVLPESSDSVGALLKSPGWVGDVARKFAEKHPQAFQGSQSAKKTQVLVDQIAALKRMEESAKASVPGNALSGGFDKWWDGRLASQGLT